jgi:predicted RNA-binding Zn ribbon-like protein
MQGNRLCLDFINLGYAAGRPRSARLSWRQFVQFLAEQRIVSAERAELLAGLSASDQSAAEDLLGHAETLAAAIRSIAQALAKGSRIYREWIEPINRILRVTEGHDELDWDGTGWHLAFVAKDEGLEWLLAAVARSAAELVAAGRLSRVSKCGNPSCELFFYDDSRTHRRRWCSMERCGNRNKVAAFARRQANEKARAHHA